MAAALGVATLGALKLCENSGKEFKKKSENRISLADLKCVALRCVALRCVALRC
jgi:hypothetical protein